MSFEYVWQRGIAYGHRLLVPLNHEHRHIVYQHNETNNQSGIMWMKLMLTDEVRAWMLDQGWTPKLERSFRMGPEHSFAALQFEKKKHAMLFKLTWG